MSSAKILVAGATGQQGGSVIQALEGKGQEVFGLTRNTGSDKAKDLANRGVTPVSANFEDPASLDAVLRGMDVFFLVSTPFEAGVDAETEHGKSAIDAAKQAGVKHIVFSSVSDADRGTGIPHFDSKYKIEVHLKDSGIPYTILAPVFFYDNMMAPFVLPGLQSGTFAHAMPADSALQAVSVKTIGELAALALLNGDRFAGKRINFAGDELTGPGYAQAIAAASGKEIGFFEVPVEKVRENSEDMALMYEWFTKVGYSADIKNLKESYPEVSWETFPEWAARQDWSVLSA